MVKFSFCWLVGVALDVFAEGADVRQAPGGLMDLSMSVLPSSHIITGAGFMLAILHQQTF